MNKQEQFIDLVVIESLAKARVEFEAFVAAAGRAMNALDVSSDDFAERIQAIVDDPQPKPMGHPKPWEKQRARLRRRPLRTKG
jgi:hypothetical protein